MISVVFVTDKELSLFKNKSHITVFCIQHFHVSWSRLCFPFLVFKFIYSNFRFISLRALDYFGLHILCVHGFTCYYCCE